MIARCYTALLTLLSCVAVCAFPGNLLAQETPTSSSAVAAENRISLGLLTIRVDNKSFLNSHAYIRRTVDGLSRSDGYDVMESGEAKKRLDYALFANIGFDEKALEAIRATITEGEELIYTNPAKASKVLADICSRLSVLAKNLSMTAEIRKDFFRAKMLLARSYFDNRDQKAAEKVLEEIVVQFGGEALDPNAHHPQVISLYDKALKKVMGQGVGVLEIESEPSGMMIIVDGAQRSETTPAKLQGVFTGEHHVQLIGSSRKSRVHRLNVEKGATTRIRISVACDESLSWASDGPTVFFENTTRLTDGIRGFSGHVANYLGVQHVLSIGLVPHNDGAAFIGYLVEGNTGRLLQSETILVNPDDVDDEAVQRMIRGLSGKNDMQPALAKKDYFGSQGPWYQQWPGWVLAGAGVVSTVLSVMYVNDFSEQKANAEDKFFHASDPDAGIRARTVEGNNARRSQKVAWVTGVIGAMSIAGAVTFFGMHARNQPSGNMVRGEGLEGAQWSFTPSFTADSAQFGFGATF